MDDDVIAVFLAGLGADTSRSTGTDTSCTGASSSCQLYGSDKAQGAMELLGEAAMQQIGLVHTVDTALISARGKGGIEEAVAFSAEMQQRGLTPEQRWSDLEEDAEDELWPRISACEKDHKAEKRHNAQQYAYQPTTTTTASMRPRRPWSLLGHSRFSVLVRRTTRP